MTEIEERWKKLPLCVQMVEVGGEVERALRSLDKPEVVKCHLRAACERLDLIIKIRQDEPIVKELTVAKETLCDFFLGNNSMKTQTNELKAYYDRHTNEYIDWLKSKR